jgi:hypothetical protein
MVKSTRVRVQPGVQEEQTAECGVRGCAEVGSTEPGPHLPGEGVEEEPGEGFRVTSQLGPKEVRSSSGDTGQGRGKQGEGTARWRESQQRHRSPVILWIWGQLSVRTKNKAPSGHKTQAWAVWPSWPAEHKLCLRLEPDSARF